ncbi:MAG TPA: NAD(P)-binding domain-containing protein [Fimbriimonas sp.]|nr:NAD(P)-binding domain-containing protein [Fimbriimonas sp.]
MKIGILGSGIVGKTLGEGFLKHGYAVMVGSRSPEKLSDWASQHAGAKTGTFAETAQYGDLLVLAVQGGVAAEALRMAGGDALKDKTILDATNPIDEAPPEDGVLRFFTGPNESLMEQLQTEFPSSNFVKAFNSVGAVRMINPQFEDGKPTMFICGNNPDAKQKAAEILDTFGWEVADMGTAQAARAIEPLCILWCIPGFLNNQWNHAFKLLLK